MKAKHIFRTGVCFIAASGLFASTTQARNDDKTIRLKPSSKWQLNFEDENCRLVRLFGEGDSKTLFYLERYDPGDDFTMVVAGSPFENKRHKGKALVRFGEVGAELEVKFASGNVGGLDPALIFSRLDFTGVKREKQESASTNPDIFGQKIAPEFEEKITWVQIAYPGQQAIFLESGSFGDAMKVMRNCTDNLLTLWGIDLEKHRQLATRAKPIGDSASWLRPSDYPTALLRKRQPGFVQVRMSVGADGKPSQCHIQQSTRPEGFDTAVCEGLMQRARFSPAMTTDGEAIASYWRTSVRFSIK